MDVKPNLISNLLTKFDPTAVKKERIPKVFIERIEKIDRLNTEILICYPKTVIPNKHKYKRYWDLCILMCIFWICVHLPWEIAFPEDSLFGLSLLILIIFIIDVFLSCVTTFENA